jgi:hypothetical protein
VLKRKAAELKDEFNKEIGRVIEDAGDAEGVLSEEDIKGDNIEEYEKRLEQLKDEVKKLKKVKKRQEKISKLEAERVDVIKEIERNRHGGTGHRKHTKH